jgi:predicted nucleic acid-binding protein
LILIDTSVLSRGLRRARPGPEEDAIRRHLRLLGEGSTPLGIPTMVLLEILSGIRGEEPFLDLQQSVLSAFEIVAATSDDYIEAARLRNQCEAKGLNVSAPDCLIARVAISRNARLFAIDGDFDRIAKVSPLKLYRFKA